MYMHSCIYTSPPNPTPRGFLSYLLLNLLLYFLFIFHLPRCTLPDFPSVSSLAFLPFFPCCHLITTSKFNSKTVSVLHSLDPSHVSFSSFTFPGAPYRIFLLFLYLASFTMLSSNINNQLRLFFQSDQEDRIRVNSVRA